MPQDYIYDVFISYRHRPPVLDWVKHHFYPLLEQWLQESMPRDVSIFIDWDIETGSAWPAKLRQALKTSRCILPICSPQYFRSPWCLAEWQTMRERERLCGLGSEDNPSGLVYAITFNDGDNFPRDAKLVQRKDLSKWNTPHPVYKDTVKYVELDAEVQELASELAGMINRAPTWEDWPVITPDVEGELTVSLPRL